jgi:polygalacturonase
VASTIGTDSKFMAASTPVDRRSVLKAAAGLLLARPTGNYADPRPPFDAINVQGRGVLADGVTDDAIAINRLIEQLSVKGSGTLYFPAGVYPCRYTLHLKDHVHIWLDAGAVIKAAPVGHYDKAEKNENDRYQDFGHGHWRNSLISGIGVRDVSISGPGRISGMGLSRQEWRMGDGTPSALIPGVADKVIGLKNCRDITLADFSLDGTAHFAILATGVDDLKIRRLVVDSARDGIDLDSCWRVEVEDCSLNVPFDDGICVKASFALGDARGSRHIHVRRCKIFGCFEVGTLRDGTRRLLPSGQGRKGRFKIGTESTGGFEDILFEDCVVDDGLGLLLATVDGGKMSGVYVRNFTGRNINNAPLFVWLGDRLRGPPGISPGAIEDVNITGFKCYGSDNDEPMIISGLRRQPITDFTLDDAYLLQMGGGFEEETYIIPPRMDRFYPETSLLGQRLPAQGLFARHVNGLTLTNVTFRSITPDRRPFIWLGGVSGANISGIQVPSRATAPLVYESREIEVVGRQPAMP